MKITIPEQYSKYKIFILPVLAALFTVLIIIFFIIPQITRTVETNKEANEANQKIVQLNQKADFLEKIDLQNYKNNVSNTFIALPDEKNYPSSINQIQVVANQSALRIINLAIAQPSKTKEGFDGYHLKLNVEGNLNSLNNFIENLKKSPRVMSIDSLIFSASQGAGDYAVELDVVTYFQPQQTTLGSLYQPVVDLTAEEISLLTKINGEIQLLPTANLVSPTGPKGKSNPFL